MRCTATGFTGSLESVFGRGQIVSGAAMLVGSVAGGFIAQQYEPRSAVRAPRRWSSS